MNSCARSSRALVESTQHLRLQAIKTRSPYLWKHCSWAKQAVMATLRLRRCGQEQYKVVGEPAWLFGAGKRPRDGAEQDMGPTMVQVGTNVPTVAVSGTLPAAAAAAPASGQAVAAAAAHGYLSK